MGRRVGRPTKINDETIEKITRAIKAGNYIETAAAYAGIVKSTLYAWLKRGEREQQRVAQTPRATVRKSEEAFVKFSNAVKEALAESEMRDVLVISKAAEEGQWQAAAWRLERKFPDRWGRRKLDIEHSGGLELKHDGVAQIEHQLASDPESRELLKELFRRGEGAGEIETGAGEA